MVTPSDVENAGAARVPWLARPGAVFALVFLWRTVLLLCFSLPVPSNDGFFYDGAVVNLILHGRYANPALAAALPISGTEMFCAYPPLYQLVLREWMTVFGASVVSALWFHWVLFGLYLLVLRACVARLRPPGWAVGLGGLFLFAITFDDRPDSLAHLWGLLAVYGWIRSTRALDAAGPATPRWAWVMAAAGILTLATSVQIGTVYGLLIGCGVLAARFATGGRIPWLPMIALAVIPAGLVALVVFGFPRVWTGFLEHARQTPSIGGWRLPRLAEVLKIVRTVPGVLAVGAVLPFLLPWGRRRFSDSDDPAARAAVARFGLVAGAGVVAPLAITAAALVLLTPNAVMFASQIQPLLVTALLALAAVRCPGSRPPRKLVILFTALAALAAVRAVGISTWGVACCTRDSRARALERVEAELDRCDPDRTVVLSCPFLYTALRHPDLRPVHCDWMAPADRHRDDTDWQGMIRLKPERIILTQFDYYRRFAPLLETLAGRPDLAQFTVTNTATLRAPDSFPSLQRVVQHVSWAPVVVTLDWK